MKLIDSLKNTKYAIKFSISNQPSNVLYNLVLGKDKNNQEIQAKVIKYPISNMDESYQNGRVNFSKMKGEISVFPFDNFISYFNTNTKQRIEEPIACKNFSSTSSSGSGGGGDIQNPNGDNSLEYGGGSIGGTTIILPPFLQQKAQYIDCRMNTWSNGTTGEITLVTWSCADGTSGVIEYENGKPIYNKGGDVPNCDSIGAIPINEGNDDDQIFDLLTGKEKCVLKELEKLDLFKKTIKKFGNGSNYNLTFKSWTAKACKSSSDDGCTDASDLANGNITVYIQNPGKGTLDVAATILHEGIHAEIFKYVDEHIKGLNPNDRPNLLSYYFQYKAQNDNTLSTSTAQHQHMVDKYVKPIAQALRQLDDNKYPLNDYMGLAWDGRRRYGWDGYYDNGNWVTLNRNQYIGSINKVLDNTEFNKDCN